MQAFAIGKDALLQGEYRLLEALGGAESRAYLAKREHRGDGLVVARLWKPSSELLHDPRTQALFERALGQMRAATLMRHPVLALVETCGGLDDGALFMISEHAEGTPLDAFVDKAGIPPLPSVIDLAYRVCSALNAAHRNGLAHAALHPRSLIVRPHDEAGALTRLQAKLIDFGAPTCMFPSPPSLHAARFMAPEQLELALKPAFERSEPTVRMNVYGCGALLYYLCTGGPPLPGQSVDELLVAHAAHKVLAPSRINPQVIPALDAIILKALDPQPRARFANAAELANALISIRFERSSSGVRHRAASDERIPRDRRITAQSPIDDVTHVTDASAAFEDEHPTSKAKKPPPLPRASSPSSEPAFPSERPTAEVQIQLPSIPPLPRITPPPPSSPPPVPEDEITAETPLPAMAQLEAEQLAATPIDRSSTAHERPAVLARPARKSIAPMNDFFGHVPPALVIAVAAVISLSIIYAVISQPRASESTIEVTPLPPAAAPSPMNRATPAPAQASEAAAGASQIATETVDPEPPVKPSEAPQRESRSRRSVKAAEPAPGRAPPSPEASKVHDAFVLKPQLEPALEPEPEPEVATRPAPAPEVATTPAPEPAREVAPPAPIVPLVPRSPIAPLPEPPRSAAPKPIAPLPEKANPRVSDVKVKGSLATSQVRRGVERAQGAVDACYRAALAARPSALPELSVEVVFDERGRARNAKATGAVPSSLQRCVENASLRITVPPPDTGTVTATWKVSL